MESQERAGSFFLNTAARFLQEDVEVESKGFNPK
jgi:hypothetical protein